MSKVFYLNHLLYIKAICDKIQFYDNPTFKIEYWIQNWDSHML